MHLKMSSAKWRQFRLGLILLIFDMFTKGRYVHSHSCPGGDEVWARMSVNQDNDICIENRNLLPYVKIRNANIKMEHDGLLITVMS